MPAIAHNPYATSAPVAASRIQSRRRTRDAAPTCSALLLRSPRALVSTASITLHRYRDLRWMRLEVRLEDLERRGSGGRAAVTAVLDHCADGDRRRIGGGIAAPPGLVELAREARDALVLLGRAGFPGDGHRERAENRR